MSDHYIHGTGTAEQTRLAALNTLTNQPFLDFLSLRDPRRVLDVGSGLGLLAAAVASATQAHVFGVEYAVAQLRHAAAHPRVTYSRADAHHLPFRDGAFNLVYARYLLEHVPHPEVVVSEMHRVTSTGGEVFLCENDVSLVRLDPPCAAFDEAWLAFQTYQRRLGGDASIGRRLYRLLRQAGFDRVELSVQPEVHWYGSPAFEPWVRNLEGNLASAHDGLLTAGLVSADGYAAAVNELRALLTDRTASATFMWNRARAVR